MSVAGCLVCLFLWTNSRPSSAVDSTPHRQTDSATVDSVQEIQAEVVAASAATSALGERVGNAESKTANVSPDSVGETASLGRSQTASKLVPEISRERGQPMNPTNNISAAGDDFITEQQARVVASEAIGQVTYDKDAVVSVQHEAGRYVVTFPVKQPVLQPGERYRGPSYAAKVVIDEKTGKVLQVKVGS